MAVTAPCSQQRPEAWALWIDPETIAWPEDRSRAGLTYRLQGHPAFSLVPVEITAVQREADRRMEQAPYIGLRLSNGSGEPLSVGQIEQILQGPLYLETIDGMQVVERSGVQIAHLLDNLYPGAARQALGISWQNEQPTLRVWAPTATRVSLLLWTDRTDSTKPQRLAATRDEDGVWTVVGQEGWENAQYLWEVRVWVGTLGSLVTNVVTDPYSIGLTVDSKRSVIVQRQGWKPRGWDRHGTSTLQFDPIRPASQQTIYEMHVRDFSIWDDSVPRAVRGTYRAFLHPESRGMRALRALAEAGVTTLHLLPTYDIATAVIPEERTKQREPQVYDVALSPRNEAMLRQVPGWSRSSPLAQAAVAAVANQDGFNWGYDPFHWMTPEGSYASAANQTGGARTLEYREMVQALHDAGLRVVQDVVFNHTYQCGQGPMSVLDRIVPGYYHRLSRCGQVETSTCCANVATERRMAQKLMVDAVVDAAVNYQIDGFRFDLMGHHSLDNMRAVRKALNKLTVKRDGIEGKSIYLYGEGWNFGEVADDALFIQATQKNIAGTGIGVFNDRLREAVRGGNPADADHRLRQGFATGHLIDRNESQGRTGRDEELAQAYHLMDLAKTALVGGIKDFPLDRSDGSGTVLTQQIDYGGAPAAFADQPEECVNYVEAHDDQTLFDTGVWKLPLGTEMNDRVRVQVLANSLVAFGQGVCFWAAGTELLRSKSLDRDSYNSGDWFNAIDWDGKWNQFGRGLPSAARNRDHWDQMVPLLERKALRPNPDDMDRSRAAHLDLLRIRTSTPLLTLGSAELIRRMVRFVPTGAELRDTPGVIAMHVDGSDVEPGLLDGTDFRQVFLVFNARPSTWVGTTNLAGEWVLHPVLQAGADPVVKGAILGHDGTVVVPARTVAVFVQT